MAFYIRITYPSNPQMPYQAPEVEAEAENYSFRFRFSFQFEKSIFIIAMK